MRITIDIGPPKIPKRCLKEQAIEAMEDIICDVNAEQAWCFLTKLRDKLHKNSKLNKTGKELLSVLDAFFLKESHSGQTQDME